jgi:hypothetical protein
VQDRGKRTGHSKEQEVLPEVPVRHWVCTFPWGVRAVLGYDKELCRVAASAFAKELSRSLKQRAKRELGLSSVDEALTGLVVVVQRTDGAPRLNVHLHVLGLDGVYVEHEHGELAFHALCTPSSDEVRDIARRTALRLHRAFQKQGRPSPWAVRRPNAMGRGSYRANRHRKVAGQTRSCAAASARSARTRAARSARVFVR